MRRQFQQRRVLHCAAAAGGERNVDSSEEDDLGSREEAGCDGNFKRKLTLPARLSPTAVAIAAEAEAGTEAGAEAG
jgi:hypothetical protein